jgi:hypothetical protein
LIVQDGLKVSCEAIDAIRESVKFVRSSAQRKESFEKIITQLGITCERRVSLDVSTRWNSTYLMMKTASGKVKWMLAKEASNEDATIRSIVLQMKKKFLKYWKLSYLKMCIPIILDPRCKCKFLEYNLKDDIEIDGPKYFSIVKRKFKEMYNAYSTEENADTNAPNEQETQLSSGHDPWASWAQHVGAQQRQRTKQNELDIYLKDQLVSPDVSIDILEWWKTNSLKYPTISRMARDVLAIPASTVASESAFSTGSRVISDYRSRLSSETVNARLLAAGSQARRSRHKAGVLQYGSWLGR